jgi:hypothetical protein
VYTSAASNETQKKEASASAKSTGFETHSSCSELESESSVAQRSNSELKQLCDRAVLMVADFSDEQLTVPKGTVLGVAQEILESLVIPVDQEESPDKGSEQVMFSGTGQKVLPKFRKYIASKLSHLSGEDRGVIEPVLLKYAELFHDDDDNDFESTDVVEHRIETGCSTSYESS